MICREVALKLGSQGEDRKEWKTKERARSRAFLGWGRMVGLVTYQREEPSGKKSLKTKGGKFLEQESDSDGPQKATASSKIVLQRKCHWVSLLSGHSRSKDSLTSRRQVKNLPESTGSPEGHTGSHGKREEVAILQGNQSAGFLFISFAVGIRQDVRNDGPLVTFLSCSFSRQKRRTSARGKR